MSRLEDMGFRINQIPLDSFLRILSNPKTNLKTKIEVIDSMNKGTIKFEDVRILLEDGKIDIERRKSIVKKLQDFCFADVKEFLENPNIDDEIKKFVSENVISNINFHELEILLSSEGVNIKIKKVLVQKLGNVHFTEVKSFLENPNVDDEIKEYLIEHIIPEELTEEIINFLKNRKIDVYIRLKVGKILDEGFRTINGTNPQETIERKIQLVLRV